jgi:hypothetical protein
MAYYPTLNRRLSNRDDNRLENWMGSSRRSVRSGKSESALMWPGLHPLSRGKSHDYRDDLSLRGTRRTYAKFKRPLSNKGSARVLLAYTYMRIVDAALVLASARRTRYDADEKRTATGPKCVPGSTARECSKVGNGYLMGPSTGNGDGDPPYSCCTSCSSFPMAADSCPRRQRPRAQCLLRSFGCASAEAGR